MEKLQKAKGFKRSHAITLFLTGVLTLIILSSCNPNNDELGRDLLPVDDNINVHYDTLFDISVFPVYSNHLKTSETTGTYQSTRTFLLGTRKDSIFGKARAEIVTQYDLSSAIVFGDNMTIDSIMLYLYITDVVGDSTSPFHIRVFETTEPIYMDSSYYSDYDLTGKYNTSPLIDAFIYPHSDSLYEFRITDLDYKNKILVPPGYDMDTLYAYDSIFKEVFTGFYITGEPVANVNTFCKIQLANAYTRLGINYTSDDIDPDSLTGVPIYEWYYFNINESTSQKINIFSHDFMGSAFNGQFGNEEYQSDFCYVQGMSGVNTKLRLNNLETWKDSGIIAINSAYLTLEVVPEELSGIANEDLPEQLFMIAQHEDESYAAIYDYLINSTVFGGTLEQIPTGNVFVSDSIYVYRFNIGLQFQAMIDGSSDISDLILQVYNPISNPNFVKLWSSYADREGQLKLEVVYTKL